MKEAYGGVLRDHQDPAASSTGWPRVTDPVERLEAPVGGQVTLGEVLFVGGGDKGEMKVGAPLIDKASVAATVVDLRARPQDPRLQVQQAQALPAHARPPPGLRR